MKIQQVKILLSIFFTLVSTVFATVMADSISPNLRAPLTIKILGVNDFHGQISSGHFVANRPVGGAAVLAAYLRYSAAGMEDDTYITFMGDQVGASIPASGLLNHEPSILALNTLANANCSFSYQLSPRCNMVATIGNHEFDRGQTALFNLINGTNQAPKNGWISLPTYPGAIFPYISANIVSKKTGKTLFPPYVIKNMDGVPIAFIGAILKHAAGSTLPQNVQGIEFLDEAKSINHYLPEIHKKGVNIIVVIIHQGGDSDYYAGDTRQNVHVNGEIKDIIYQLNDGVDVVMAGHTHRFLNAYLPNHNGQQVLVTQASSYSADYAEVTLQVDPSRKQVVKKSARIITTFADVYPGTKPDATTAKIVSAAENNVAAVVNQHVGTLSYDLSHDSNAAGESDLGNLIADAFRSGLQADIGITNLSSVRTDLRAGDITWGLLYAVEPFGNPIIKLTLSGKDVHKLLEQQWKTENKNILQVSGLSYAYDETHPMNHRVSDILINGVALNPNRTYSIAVNSYLAKGGSGFSVLQHGKVIGQGASDLESLVTYIKSLPQPFSTKIEGRIKQLH